MPYILTIPASVTEIALPDRKTYNGPATAYLTDEQFDQVTQATLTAHGITWLPTGQATNIDGISLIAAVGATTTQNSPAQINPGARGGHFVINVTSAGTGSITPHIQAQDPISGVWYDLLVGAAITTPITTVLKVYPGLVVVANVAANDVLPHTWRAQTVANNANPVTYTVAASLLG